MASRHVTGAVILWLIAATAVPAQAGCKLGLLAELPVTMDNMRPTVAVSFNGADSRLIVDSGAFYSLISMAVARQFNLRLEEAPENLRLSGIGKESTGVSVARVKSFGLAALKIPDVEFLAGGSEMSGSAVGVLGQNILGIADAEYDLAHGVIRLMRPHDCTHGSLAYWKSDNDFSSMDIQRIDDADWHTVGLAYLNGNKIRVLFDTGASTSILSLRAAARAGVKPDDPGVVPAGDVRGIGRKEIPTWIAPFATFAIGDEEVRNTRLRIGDLWLEDIDMLLGADFFLSHHIYVANDQHKIYFSYNGGPVFNLATPKVPPKQDDEKTGIAVASPAAAAAALPSPNASELARRGAAAAARRDYASALADLTHACELDPSQGNFFYERSRVYLMTGKPDAALADINRALQLMPTDTPSLLLRAGLRQKAGQQTDADADLQLVTNTISQMSDDRFEVAEMYFLADQLPESLAQFDIWVKYHAYDAKLPYALIGRCWAHGALNSALHEAENDCNRALRLIGKANSAYADTLADRGLVRLRLDNVKGALEDYEASLVNEPKHAWPLYGRGLCRLRLGQKAQGDADLAAATAIRPGIGAEAAKYGLAPAQ